MLFDNHLGLLWSYYSCVLFVKCLVKFRMEIVIALMLNHVFRLFFLFPSLILSFLSRRECSRQCIVGYFIL